MGIIITTSFEKKFGQYMDDFINIEMNNYEMRISCKKRDGKLLEETLPIAIYKNAVEESHYHMKLNASSIYVTDKLNCFIEKNILYLDSSIPFSTQMNEIKSLGKYFYIYYKKIRYEGEIGTLEKAFNLGKLISINQIKNEEGKTTSMLASIKLKLNRLHPTFIDYVNMRISKIYASPEERLESIVDLTKPIDNIDEYSIHDQLEKLNSQILVLLEASKYMNSIGKKEIPDISLEVNELDDLSKKCFQTQIEKERIELFDRVKENAILEIEGKKHKTIEELEEEFKVRICSYCKLLKDYYSKNMSAYRIIYNESNSEDLIIARIKTIYSFYGEKNPYREKIEDYKNRIEECINKRVDSNKIVEEYKKYLDDALEKAESFAFSSCIELWKNHTSNIVYGMNPIFSEIGKVVENYNIFIDKIISNKVVSYGGRRNLEYERECNEAKQQFDNEYLSIIRKIEHIYFSNDEDNYPINKDEEYRKLLKDMEKLVDEVKFFSKSKLRKDSIQSIIDNKFVNYTKDDEEFDCIFKHTLNAFEELNSLRYFTTKSTIFNLDVISNHYESIKSEYETIVRRISEYFLSNGSKDEYDSIIRDLNELINKIRIICENENKLLATRDELQQQKRLF